MTTKEEILKQVHAALEHEPRVNIHAFPIHMEFSDGTVALTGDVDGIAAKKLAVRLTKGVPGVSGVVDHLRVVPREQRGDGAILDALAHALLNECDLKNCTLRQRNKGQAETLHEAIGDDACGEVEFSVADGEITLEGHVISLSHKRIVGAMAWWVPGCRNVVNRLHVEPAEEDNDDEVTDAVRLVLELDPHVHAAQVSVHTVLRVVSLDGLVTREEEKRTAETDAWYVTGVNEVINRIEVRA